MRIEHLRPTEHFVATPDGGDAQVLEVLVAGADGSTLVATASGRVVGTAVATGKRVELPLAGLAADAVGTGTEVTVSAADAHAVVTVVRAEPGWTAWLIPHFHYDPVWWNTQAAYTATWDDLPGQAQEFRQVFQQPGFALVDAHLATARRDPDYRFVLAEVDYLKPYWDARPANRTYLRRLIADGRVEIMGGTYNEPNTNLTTTETTIRNVVHGIGFQRDVLGGDPRTAWQLDVFGHDPQFPGLAADAGLTSSSWARGPFHQWGPMLTRDRHFDDWDDPSVMQFPAEFDWVSPSGRGVLTHYMPAHYSAGWRIDSATTLVEAEDAVHDLLVLLRRVAATHHVLIPVGTDYTPPAKWVTDIQRQWNARYSWPRFECAVPRDFFAAVRTEFDERGRRPVPQTRDMNPVYTGKDVSFIDTKQAQRAAESLLVEAELFASFAALRGAHFPHAALDKAWRQLVYGAHHDAITGSESDQVYLDLLTGWREAHDVGRSVLAASLDHLTSSVTAPRTPGVPVTVFNPSAWARSDVVTVEVELPSPASDLSVVGPDGAIVPSVVEAAVRDARGRITSASVQFVVDCVPALGYATGWSVREGDSASRWERTDSTGIVTIENDALLVEVDPAAGGCVRRVFDKRAGGEVLHAGGFGNELVAEQEYSAHPEFHEGPWHLVPKGEELARSSQRRADSVEVFRSPLGARVVVTGMLGGTRYTQTITLLSKADRLDCRTTLDGFEGADVLVRVCWEADVPGALPVSDVGSAVIGRGFGFRGTDVGEHPWTLDNPAVNWFALSSTARVRVASAGGSTERAVGVAELVAPDLESAGELRDLAAALVAQGVTATTSAGTGTRYGVLAIDSNLPDVRIAVGGPDENAFVAQVFDTADPQYRTELESQLARTGTARVWVPARAPLTEVWQPSADLSGALDLPVLVVVGGQQLASLVADLDDAVIEVAQSAVAVVEGEAALTDRTVALLNTGLPSFNVGADGTLSTAVLRSCTGWPSGVWINPPRRTAPDGSTFQQQHWTHHFDYALVSAVGDWRRSGVVRAGHELQHPLRASVTAPGDGAATSGSYLSVAPDDPSHDVVVTAVKPAGNPLAGGRPVGAVDALAVRLVESSSRPGSVTVSVDGVPADAALDLLDVERRPLHGPLALRPAEVATVRVPVSASDESLVLAADREPHQPVYTRYWLDNTGPAPVGGLPVAVHLEPTVVERAGGDDAPIELSVTVASDRTDADVSTRVRVVVAPGWTATPDVIDVHVPARGHVEHAVVVLPAADASGSWWVRAQAEVANQVVEDVTRVLVGAVDGSEVDIALTGPDVLHPGDDGVLVATITNNARTATSGRVQLISPWHTWELVTDVNAGFAAGPGETVTVRFPVHVAPGVPAGSWWALAKLAAAGCLRYTAPVELIVAAP